MPKDFENSINLDQLVDDEARDLVRQRLEDADDFDADAVDIDIRDGRVTVEGRVGTEEERQQVEQVLTLFGAEHYANNVVVDELVRAKRSLGERGPETSDTAEHLREDTAGDMYGTRDMRKAIEQGQSYTLPDGPMQDGIGGGDSGERH